LREKSPAEAGGFPLYLYGKKILCITAGQAVSVANCNLNGKKGGLLLKRVVLILVLILLLGSGSAAAFNTASIQPGYNALLYNVMVGTITGDFGLMALRIGVDIGLTPVVGMEGTISYRGENMRNLVDLATKFQIWEHQGTDVALRVGFHGVPLSDWRLSLGMLLDHEVLSFFTARAGASLSFGEGQLGWKYISYYLGGDFSITAGTSVQLGIFKNIRDNNPGSIMLGLQTRL